MPKVSKKIEKSATKSGTQKPHAILQVLIIGVGNMGAALAKGLLHSKLSESMTLSLYDHKPEGLDKFEGMPRVKCLETLTKANACAADVIILCTKPQDLDSVARVVSGQIKPDALLISILAAVTTEDLAQRMKFRGAIVRSMPNIAATVGEAATALCHNDHCDTAHMEVAHQIFTSFGTASWTKESLMDAVTGLSGSGPAYIYMVIEALTDGGVKMGMPRPLALELATQTVLGSAMLVQSTGLHPAILRDQVTTPGGTTISAIHELEERGLRAMLISAVSTATERSKTLRQN
jgi:pyrroline-5-carboxylate reductase